ncbi:hypothetical protein [Pyrobaculum aerophilum]|uniref:Uncharacterized protein n=1 Tax=Pyrobaculum aerophilum TaxID=13773 RepID=A0A371R7C8_9CREN|nr:hypothetical protein [Pyrobaculum aerophilum]RFA98337.1 hypothetical protein CGL51_01330 [Pyrobaculum aerophilum]RFB00439.1 hypothetical protein CGL52_00895 [Pyrobaculum aerophilum]
MLQMSNAVEESANPRAGGKAYLPNSQVSIDAEERKEGVYFIYPPSRHKVEEVPEELRVMLEAYRDARRPRIKIGFIRVKKVIGVIYGSEDKAEGKR